MTDGFLAKIAKGESKAKEKLVFPWLCRAAAYLGRSQSSARRGKRKEKQRFSFLFRDAVYLGRSQRCARREKGWEKQRFSFLFRDAACHPWRTATHVHHVSGVTFFNSVEGHRRIPGPTDCIQRHSDGKMRRKNRTSPSICNNTPWIRDNRPCCRRSMGCCRSSKACLGCLFGLLLQPPHGIYAPKTPFLSR